MMAKQTQVMVALQVKSQKHTELISQTNVMVMWIYKEMQAGKRLGDGEKFHSQGGMNRETQKGMSQTVGGWTRGTTGGESAKGEDLSMLSAISPEMPHQDIEDRKL